MFKPRRFASRPDAVSSANNSAVSLDMPGETSLASLANVTAYAGQELTKNENYCVSRLPAVPPLLDSNRMDEDSLFMTNGYADNATKFAVAVGDATINVWPYTSTDETPITFEFPIDEYRSADGMAPLAILTAPSLGSSLDPGLVIVGSSSGKVRYYESVQHAPAIGLINPERIETKLALHAGELINLAENIDSVGVVVATTWKRVFVICLRDFRGNANLSIIEMLGVSKGSRLLSFLGGGKSPEDVGDEIVSIRQGRSLEGGGQEIIVQDAKGVFRKFVHRVSASGARYIDPSQTLHYKLAPYLENNIDGLIPGTLMDVKFLDIWPLATGHRNSNDLYTALVYVINSLNSTSEKNLLLITFKIDHSGVLSYGSHQLPHLEFHDTDVSKPSLYIPFPCTTAFVVVGNTVVLTDINTAFLGDSDSDHFLYYKPRWEDVVRLKSHVHTVGYGFENCRSSNSHPGLIILTKTDGVIRIERFPSSGAASLSDMKASTEPVSLLKSHLRQAIFYQHSETLDFDVGPEYSDSTVVEAVNAIVAEVLDSSSESLPPFFPSLRDSLIIRANLMHELINFVHRNFESSWAHVLPTIVEALEKLEVSHNLWTMLDATTAEAALLKDKVTTIIREHGLVPSTSTDIARDFFTYKADDVVIILTDLIQELNTVGESLRTIIKLLVGTLYNGIFKNEASFIYGNSDIEARKMWIYETNLLATAEAAFDQIFSVEGKPAKGFDFLSKEDSLNLVNLVETFYYLVTTAIQYMQDSADEQLASYVDWYRLRRKSWISFLVKNRLIDDALYIAEKYQDFSSVASILETERQQVSPELIDDKLHHFFDVYGYDFASKLFDFYIKNDKIPQLLLKFENHQSFLERYFEENAQKSAKIAWIHYIKANDYSKASHILMAASAENSTSSQESNEVMLSIAKLTAVAAKLEAESPLAIAELDEMATEAEDSLTVSRAQNRLYEQILLNLLHNKQLLTYEYFSANFLNPKYPQDYLNEDFKQIFVQFAQQTPLDAGNLIQILTVIHPIGNFKGVFAHALEVAGSINNDADFRKQAIDIWLKVIALTDDWARITATDLNTDDVNKSRVQETVFYHTISLVKDNEDIIAALNDAVKEASISEDTVLLSKVHGLIVKKNLLPWIESIKAEIKQFQP